MSDKASPRPWRVEASQSQGKFWICQTTLGVSIGETWKESDALLIVAAVNERDRLREAIRHIANAANHALGYLDAVAPREAFLNIAPSDLRNIVEIARAALGEERFAGESGENKENTQC